MGDPLEDFIEKWSIAPKRSEVAYVSRGLARDATLSGNDTNMKCVDQAQTILRKLQLDQHGNPSREESLPAKSPCSSSVRVAGIAISSLAAIVLAVLLYTKYVN